MGQYSAFFYAMGFHSRSGLKERSNCLIQLRKTGVDVFSDKGSGQPKAGVQYSCSDGTVPVFTSPDQSVCADQGCAEKLEFYSQSK